MQPDADPVTGGAFIFFLLIWTGLAYLIWLFVRKRHKFGVVWFYTNLTVAALALLAGNTSSGYSALFVMLGMLRFVFLGIGWIVKMISKQKVSIFRTSRICWAAVGITVLVLFGVSAVLHVSQQHRSTQATTEIATPALDPFFSEYNRRYLAKAYGATVDVISMADVERIKAWQHSLIAWNDNTAKIFRDYKDPLVAPAQFVTYSKKYLDELRQAQIEIGYSNSSTDDPGIKAMIDGLLAGRTKTLDGWSKVQTACALNDPILAKTGLSEIEDARQTDLAFGQGMVNRAKAAGFDVEKDIDNKRNLDRTLKILKSPSGS
jgi:hypothetical protein